MSVPAPPAWDAVFQALVRIFQRGLRLKPDVLHAIESTFCAKTATDVRAVLAGPSEDRHILAEMIFYPDEHVQEQLEPLLAQAPLGYGDVQALRERLLADPPAVNFHLAFQDNPFSLFPDPFLVDQFVGRLNLLNPVEPEIARALARHFPPGLLYPSRVRIRNARIRLTPGKREWLLGFITSAGAMPGDLVEMLEFVLWFFPCIGDQSDIREELERLKTVYASALRSAGRYDTQLAQSNIETLMAAGRRTGHVDKEAALCKIACIDRICRCVYGEAPVVDVPLDFQGNVRYMKRSFRGEP